MCGMGVVMLAGYRVLVRWLREVVCWNQLVMGLRLGVKEETDLYRQAKGCLLMARSLEVKLALCTKLLFLSMGAKEAMDLYTTATLEVTLVLRQSKRNRAVHLLFRVHRHRMRCRW